MPKSTSQKPGPRKKLRPTVLGANGGKTVVVVVPGVRFPPKAKFPEGIKLNRLGIVGSGKPLPKPSRTEPRSITGALSARGQGVSGVSTPVQSNAVNGTPVWNWKIPAASQPPRSHLRQPPPPPQQPPSNQLYGASQMTLPIKRCLTSKSDGP